MITAISGIRDIHRDSERVVVAALRDLLMQTTDAHEVRFGGALGVDTVALEAAKAVKAHRSAGGRVWLKVIVPFTVGRQPARARTAIESCADEVVELHLPATERVPYFVRNNALLADADQLAAFTDGRTRGGTAYTIQRATKLRIRILQHQVEI